MGTSAYSNTGEGNQASGKGPIYNDNAPSSSLEWLQEPGTGRLYMDTFDDQGNWCRFYWDEKPEASSAVGSQSQYTGQQVEPVHRETGPSGNVAYPRSQPSHLRSSLPRSELLGLNTGYVVSGASSSRMHPPYNYDLTFSSNAAYTVHTDLFAEQWGPAQSSAPITLTAANTSKPLDPRFKVHSSTFFKAGRVFKTLWIEPAGNNTGSLVDGSAHVVHNVVRGESVYSKMRHFVVVRGFQRHCLCVPITTYGRQGVAKQGIRPQDHAVVYEFGNKAKLSAPEQKFAKVLKRPFEVRCETGEKIDPMTRINLSKLYTVEYNVKVAALGTISTVQMDRLRKDAGSYIWDNDSDHEAKTGANNSSPKFPEAPYPLMSSLGGPRTWRDVPRVYSSSANYVPVHDPLSILDSSTTAQINKPSCPETPTIH